MSEFRLRQIREAQAEGIAIAKLKGRYSGRKINTKETPQNFLDKPKSKKIIELIEKGRTYYEIRKILSCSPSTIKKVKRLLEESQVSDASVLVEA